MEQQPVKFRKKPVIVEAMQFDGTHFSGRAIRSWVAGGGGKMNEGGVANGELQIVTLEGRMTARAGDWIIRGVKGEFYPCKPDIFTMTYEPVG